MFDNFPYNYYEFLEQRQRQDEKAKRWAKDSSNNLGKCFGSFYQGLHTHLSAPCFDFMRTAFNDYVETIWGERNGAKGEHRENIACEKIAEYITCNEARRHLRVNVEVNVEYVKYLVLTQQLHAVKRQTSNKQTFLVNFDSLMQVKLKHEGSINIKSVASQLGYSIQVCEQLVSNGCLPAICTPKLSGFKLWQLPHDAAEHLIAAVIAAVRCKIERPSNKTQNVEVLNYRTVCRRLLGWNVKVSYFVKGILLNKIKPHGETKKGKGLHRFTFLASDLDDYLEPCIAAFYAKRMFRVKNHLRKT